MPTYDYLCGKCGHRFEAFQAITDKPLGKCPSCGSNKVKRLIGTGAGIIFKGSGFYTTDNKRSSALSGSGNGSSRSETKSEPKSEPKSEAKPSSEKSESPAKK